jgi:uncharacterized repeat protein (TIGR01451 family)
MPNISTRVRIGLIGAALLAALLALTTQTVTPALAGFTPTPTDTPTPAPPPTVTPPPPPPSSTGLTTPLLSKSVDKTRAQVGEEVAFTITVTNPNNADYNGLTVTDVLPPQVDFINATTPLGSSSYDAASRTVTFNLGTLGPNQTVALTIRARLNAQAQPPAVIDNVAMMNNVVTSNLTSIQTVPGELPQTGFPPDESLPPTWLLVLLAAFLPLYGYAFWALARASLRRRR